MDEDLGTNELWRITISLQQHVQPTGHKGCQDKHVTGKRGAESPESLRPTLSECVADFKWKVEV